MRGETGALVWLWQTVAGLPFQLLLNKSDSSDVSETAARVSGVLGARSQKMAARHLWRVGTIGGIGSGWLDHIKYRQSEFSSLRIKWRVSSSARLAPPRCLVANVNS